MRLLLSTACALVIGVLSAQAEWGMTKQAKLKAKLDFHQSSICGVVLFAYGHDSQAVGTYLQDVLATTHGLLFFTRLPVTIVTNFPDHPQLKLVSTLRQVAIRPVAATAGLELVGKQWVTRILELQNLPYNLTYAVDAGSYVCSSSLEKYLADFAKSEYDAAFQSQAREMHRGFHVLGGFLLLRRSIAVANLVKHWHQLQVTTYKDIRDDQHALNEALCHGMAAGLRVTLMDPRHSYYGRHLGELMPQQTRMVTGEVSLVHWTTRWGPRYSHSFICDAVNGSPPGTNLSEPHYHMIQGQRLANWTLWFSTHTDPEDCARISPEHKAQCEEGKVYQPDQPPFQQLLKPLCRSFEATVASGSSWQPA